MNAIRKLDPKIVAQIAAGEVVDRPSAVLKELLENASDAGATSIEVKLSQGGISLISVADDGHGIAKDQMALAIVNHATSKVQEFSDLQGVASYGFRGEALASICSVSDFSITSTTSGADESYAISASNASVQEQTKHREQGTTIEVRNLFAHLPARRKFLKTEQTEKNHCLREFKHFALANTNMQLCLWINGKRALEFAAESIDARVQHVLGSESLAGMQKVNESSSDTHLLGWLSLPDFVAPSSFQWLFVCGRPVQDRRLHTAVRQGYQGLTHGDHHKLSYVLFIECNPDLVDVNVHPAKKEVKFLYESGMFSMVKTAVANAFQNSNPQRSAQMTIEAPSSQQEWVRPQAYAGTGQQQNTATLREGWGSLYKATDSLQTVLPKHPESEPAITPETILEVSLGHALGLLKNTFILAENEQGLVVVDVHAAHERILFEQIRSQYATGTLEAQKLLVPLVVPADDQRQAMAKDRQQELKSLAFEIEVQNTALLVHSVPAILASTSTPVTAETVVALLEDLHGGAGAFTLQEQLDTLLGNMACKQALKSGMQMNIEQMNDFLRQMEACEKSHWCNHGRPAWTVIAHDQFDRICRRGQ